MAQNTKLPMNAKDKICGYPVILERPYKWFVPITGDSPLPFVTKMATLIGASTACHTPQPEYYRESKQKITYKVLVCDNFVKIRKEMS